MWGELKHRSALLTASCTKPIELPQRGRLLNQVVVFQVALQDVVLHRVEDKSNVVGVCSAGEVGVDDFFLVRVEADKRV